MIKMHQEQYKYALGCVWVKGVVALFFLRYHSLKAHTTLSRNKKYMLFSKRCGSFLKKNNHTSQSRACLATR